VHGKEERCEGTDQPSTGETPGNDTGQCGCHRETGDAHEMICVAVNPEECEAERICAGGERPIIGQLDAACVPRTVKRGSDVGPREGSHEVVVVLVEAESTRMGVQQDCRHDARRGDGDERAQPCQHVRGVPSGDSQHDLSDMGPGLDRAMRISSCGERENAVDHGRHGA